MVTRHLFASLMNVRMLFLSMFAYAVLLSVLRVQFYWSTQPWEGDFPFYVQCCTAIPSGEHLPVPVMLYSINLFVNNPVAVTLVVSGLGYTLMFLLVYLCGLQLTGNTLASVITYFCFAAMIPFFLTPTAIKNMYGLIFMLLSIMVLDKYLKQRDTKLLVPLSLSVLLTAITHSIPIFPLTTIMLVNVVPSLRKNSLLLVLLSAGSAVGMLMLEVLSKTVKLFDILRNFASTPLQVIILNIGKYTRPTPPYILHITVTLFVIGSAIGFLRMHQNVHAMFVGLFLATSILLFIGDVEYGERLLENAAPLVALIVGYCLNCVRKEGIRK